MTVHRFINFRRLASLILPLLLALVAGLPLSAREKDRLPYGEGLIVNIPMAESDVEQVVEDVAQNGVIRGTKEYNKDEFISGAKAATSSHVFPEWTEGGKVFYKVREQAIDPRNFKDGGDVGTLVVRYVVQAQGDKNTVLRIDALFREDFRRTVHPSNGSVESNEYKDIHEHLEALELMKKENVEADRERQDRLVKKQNPAIRGGVSSTADSELEAFPQSSPRQANVAPTQFSAGNPPAQLPPSKTPAQPSSEQVPPAQSLEEQVKNLRKQVERVVKAPGAPLKSAPFHTASTLQSLAAGTEILILISTPYWYGVETHEGQHGWIMRDQLEQP